MYEVVIFHVLKNDLSEVGPIGEGSYEFCREWAKDYNVATSHDDSVIALYRRIDD